MFINKIKSNYILILILIIGGIFRLWQLGSVPISPDWDEASLGYNAYSLLHTGKDEYGKSLPIILESFGDYKPAFYSYLAIPSVAIFGLNLFAVRLPSALFGIATIAAVYYLVSILFKRKDIALLSSLLLALSPWHIQFSRVAFETNVGLAFNIFGALFFIAGLKRPWLLTLSALSFGFSIHTYQSEKVFVPLLVLFLCIIFIKSFLKLSKKWIFIAGFVGLVVIFPIVVSLISDSNTLGRAKGVSIFSERTHEFNDNIKKLELDKKNGDILGQIQNNRRVFYAKQAISNYLSHFDLNWLFVKGDIPRHHAPNMGLLYHIELPFLLIGIYSFIFGNFSKRTKALLFAWFFIAPLPAALTTGVPHAVRTMNFLPTFQIFIAIGIISSLQYLLTKKILIIRKTLGIIFIIGSLVFLYSFNIFYYLNQYFIQMNYYYSQDWQYGYKEAVKKTNELSSSYSKVVVANDGYLDQSYIFYLFYLAYNPEQYQKEAKKDEFTRSFGKYEFRPINWETVKNSNNILFVGMPDDFPAEAESYSDINFRDGKPAIKIVGT